MSTTPADLRAAAERAYKWYVTPNVEDAHRNIPDHVFYTGWQACKHILATVHADDDEPVTVEWLLSIGGEDRREGSVPCIQFSDSNVLLWYYPKVDVWHVSGSAWKPKTRGQLRHLLAGLGMGGGE